ncbi:hypothetical protein PUN28_003245 [Cardiocondyla obscurior]|uniref:Uncharacterized protein n=1 Tax=Cardiocondyla obscurior TaxID=286306 RepID=A0AAW2GJL0_9HYME
MGKNINLCRAFAVCGRLANGPPGLPPICERGVSPSLFLPYHLLDIHATISLCVKRTRGLFFPFRTAVYPGDRRVHEARWRLCITAISHA